MRPGMKAKVLALVDRGLPTQMIADKLGVCTGYVRSTRARSGMTETSRPQRIAYLRETIARRQDEIYDMQGELERLERLSQ
jgi:hypothetical protein